MVECYTSQEKFTLILCKQGRSYDFVIGTAIGEGSGDRLGPGQGPGLGPRGQSPRKRLHFNYFQ